MSTTWRFLLGLFLGVAVSGFVVTAIISSALHRGLPQRPDVLLPWSSPRPGLVRSASGATLHEFDLVEPVQSTSLPVADLVEAYLASAPTDFYEARRRPTLGLWSTLRRALAGEPPAASPLSVALARPVLAAEEPGPRRRMRVALLAARFDRLPPGQRAAVWLQWVPLCWGSRGIDQAVSACLGGRWGVAEQSAVAAAAVWGLDLAEDRTLLLARRESVLETLVKLGRLAPEELGEVPEPSAPRVPSGGLDSLAETAARLGRQAARVEPWLPVTVGTRADEALHVRLRGALAPLGVAWVVLDVQSAAVLSMGGDVERRRLTDGFEGVLAGAPVGPAGAEITSSLNRASLRRATELLAACAREGLHRPMRVVDWVDGVEGRLAEAVVLPGRRLVDAETAYVSLLSLQPGEGLRRDRFGELTVLAHPSFVAAFAGPLAPAKAEELLRGWYQPAPFPVPDGVALDARGGSVRPFRRDRWGE